MFLPQQDQKTFEEPAAEPPVRQEQVAPVVTLRGRAEASVSGERRDRSRTPPVADTQMDTDHEAEAEPLSKKDRAPDPSGPREGGAQVAKAIAFSRLPRFFPTKSL